mgnify:CR=1 FL=1
MKNPSGRRQTSELCTSTAKEFYQHLHRRSEKTIEGLEFRSNRFQVNGPVVQRLDNTIHSISQKVLGVFIHWTALSKV